MAYPPDVQLIPTDFTPRTLNLPDRGWRFYLARRGDGVCWAVVHDGLTAHEGPPRYESEFNGNDFNEVVWQLEAYARAAVASSPGN